VAQAPCPLADAPRPRRREPIRLDAGWLEKRFDLFERYCLPSAAAQAAGSFHWIVYFDSATPPRLRDRIERCRQTFPFVARFVTTPTSAFWPRSLAEAATTRTPWILTTRLDNDDALACDHVARLQAAVSRKSAVRGSWNFPRGFVLANGRLYALTHLANAFASWFEPWDDLTRTAISIAHLKMSRFGDIAQIDGPPAWLQVIHGGNISNKVRGRRVLPAEAAGHFPAPLLSCLRPVGSAEIALENRFLTPLRRVRDAASLMLRGYDQVIR
jgi:Putative rhamnosyl transferase